METGERSFMKRFSPRNIIKIFLYIISISIIGSFSVQAKDHFSDATPLSKSLHLCLEPYEEVIYYFSFSSRKILFTSTNSPHISYKIYDSNGNAVTSFHGSKLSKEITVSPQERYFIKMTNESTYDSKFQFSYRFISDKQKNTSNNNTSNKQKNNYTNKKKSSKKNSKKRNNNKKNSKKNKKNNITYNHKYKQKQYIHDIPMPKKSLSTQLRETKKSAIKPTNRPTTKPVPISSIKQITHFLRIPAGTSLSLTEKLFPDFSDVEYQYSTQEQSVSLQNGILYSPKPGIYIVEINYQSYHSTCTVKVTV